MIAVRVGHIEFLNCYPLYYGLEQRAAAGVGAGADFELVPGVPTDLNRMLLSGTIDFGPISSIAYARNHRDLALSPRLSISAKGAVDSIQLISRQPIDRVDEVALTPKSATSVVLLKTILKLRYGREATYVEMTGTPEEALARHGAVLLIGDEGLEAMYFPFEGARAFDLGQVWQDWTGLPMVYAVWAARREFLAARGADVGAVEEELVASMSYGRANVSKVVESALDSARFGRECLQRYFRMLHYGFEAEYRRGLVRFYELAHAAGEIPEVPELHFLDVDGGRLGSADAPEDAPAAERAGEWAAG